MDHLSLNLMQLNQAQQQAVTHDLGNLLVLAGAGSGKTRVLVHRLAWLVQNYQADPYNIMVVTFTNKAAQEMYARLAKIQLLNLKQAWIGTFHSICHKFLRLHRSYANLADHFEVIDAEDQLRVIKRLLKSLNLDPDQWEPKQIQNFINRQKDQGIRSHNLPKITTKYDRGMFEIYAKYELACKQQHLIDFAELLFRTYELLRDHAELLAHYKTRFKHFLIDEFQDTNHIQYDFLKLLSQDASSVTAVGDDDQSIYGWRGAKVENIRKYTKEFNNVQIIRLEKNYRSTKTILAAANAIINNNLDRMGKTLWTDAPEGAQVLLYGALNEADEAVFMVKEIQKYLAQGGKYNDIAILYRSNSQSRSIEEALMQHGINYIVYGGVSFFERAEIKDVLAYLRLAINAEDNAAFERIINVPARGVGERTLEKIRSVSQAQGISYFAATKEIVRLEDAAKALDHNLRQFIKIIEELYTLIIDDSYELSAIVNAVIELSGILATLKKQKNAMAFDRIENLQELINATAAFNEKQLDQLTETVEIATQSPKQQNVNKIMALLDYAALEGKEYLTQSTSSANNLGNVKLMTIHAAKGLEFPVVFLCGMEEGLFPHHFAKDHPDSLNEERRLCYVGITRSMQQLFLTFARKRRLFGREEARLRSRFILEIPNNLIYEHKKELLVINRSLAKTKALNRSPSLITTKTSGSQSKKLPAKPFARKVKHSKFGVGVILDQDGSGDKTRVNVDFGKNGTKWLLLSYANLEVIN